MNTAFGFPWSARVVQVMTPIFGVVAPLIDPAGQRTANPIISVRRLVSSLWSVPRPSSVPA